MGIKEPLPFTHDKGGTCVEQSVSKHFFSKGLNGGIFRLLLTVACITLVAASLPLFFSISQAKTASITLETLKQVFLWGFLSLAVTLPVANWRIRKKISNPLRDVLMAAQKIEAGNLNTWETQTELAEIKDLSRSVQNISTHLQNVLRNIINTTQALSMLAESISSNSRKLGRGTRNEAETIELVYDTLKTMNDSCREISQNVENLFDSTEETSSAILEISATTNQVNENTRLLSESVEDTSTSISEMTSSLKEIAQGVEALSNSSEELVSTIAEIDMSIREVSGLSKESVRVAEQVAINASEMGMMSVVDTINGMDEIQEAVEKSATIVNRLFERSEDIGRILTVINEVSEQTELLSLNASILAAQAGENGKGFAVVANEIKALADRTGDSTKEIKRIVKAVQDEARDAVQAIEEGKEKAEKGKNLSLEAGTALKKILDNSRTAAEIAQRIEQTAVEQSKGVSFVRESVDKTNTMIEQIYRAINNQKEGSIRIQESSEQINELGHQLKKATEEQTIGTQQISTALEKIINQIRTIENILERHNAENGRTVNAVYNIRKSTKDRVAIATELETSIDSLQEEHASLKEMLVHFKTG